MRKEAVLFFILCIIFIGNVSASFDLRNESVVDSYSAGDKIKGFITISFSDEIARGQLTSNFQGNMSLIDFLDRNNITRGKNYSCNSFDCGNVYSSNASLTQFNVAGEKNIGLRFTGENIDGIDSVSLGVSTSGGPVCGKSFSIDVLGDGEDVITNDVSSGQACEPKDYGCFNKTLGSYSEKLVSNFPLCEKIELQSGPSFKVGARVKDSMQGAGELRMRLLDLNGNQLADDCILGAHPGGEADLECVIEHSSSSMGSYLVCLIGDANLNDITAGNAPNYKIKYEQSGSICGYDSSGNKDNRDYEIFGRAMQFGSFSAVINDNYFEEKTGTLLKDYINDYLFENFESGSGGLDCSPECVVPIKFIGQEQVSINNVQLIYNNGDSDNKIYDVSLKPSVLSSDVLKLDLEKANFIIPFESKAKEFILRLNGNEIISKKINIKESFDFDLSPKFVLVGRATTFTAITNKNVSSSSWNFGDGETFESNSKSTAHTYTDEGSFDLEVILNVGANLTSRKNFNITVGDARTSANLTIKEYKERIGNLTNQINSFSGFLKSEIEGEIEIRELRASLTAVENRFEQALDDEDYLEVVDDLLELDIPISIFRSSSGTLPIEIGLDNIDVKYIEAISNKKASNPEDLELAIVGWLERNYDVEVDFEVVSLSDDNGIDVLLSKFRFDITEKDNAEEGYLIIDYPLDEIKFAGDYGQRGVDSGSGTYLSVSSDGSVEFLIKEEIDLEDLGAYLSPEISKFSIDDREICEGDECPKAEFPLVMYLLTTWGLLILFFIIYMILQQWYKKRYERYLFKNPDDLYNLINFIYNGRKSGLADGEIRRKLKDSGWGGEKITYAFRKIDGKRTGMFEIPLLKFRENKKVREEIAMRHGGIVDARFIKRPNL